MKTAFARKLIDPFVYLFWKMQISILRGCPPLTDLLFSYNNVGATNSCGLWLKTLFQLAAQAPNALLLNWRDKRSGRIVLPHVSIVVATSCTLHCDKCLAHIPDLPSCGDIPLEELVRDMNALFSCVDYINHFSLAGGEAFMHPELDTLIRLSAQSGKVGDTEVATNGTIIPGEKVLAALRDVKGTVEISKYDLALQPNVEKLKRILEENGIHYTHKSALYWSDSGGLDQLQAGSARRRFSVCIQRLGLLCHRGKLHLCPSSAMMEEGLVPACADDAIDLRAARPAEFPEQLRTLLKKRALTACAYCLGYTYRSPRVPVAVQRKDKERK